MTVLKIVDTLTHVQFKNHIRLNSPICRPSRSAPIVISAITIFTLWIASRQSANVLNVAQWTWDAAISLTSPTKKEELAFWKKLSVPAAPGLRPFHPHRLTFAVTFPAGRWLTFSSTFASDWTSPVPFDLAQLKMQLFQKERYFSFVVFIVILITDCSICIWWKDWSLCWWGLLFLDSKLLGNE